MKRLPKWMNEPEWHFIPWVGPYNPKSIINWSYVRSRSVFWAFWLVLIPVLVGLSIFVLQSIFPWWPR